MKRSLIIATLIFTLALSNTANAALNFSFSPIPLNSNAETVLTIQSGWQESLQIFPEDAGYAPYVVVSGNVVNLNIVGGNGLILFPDILTWYVNLGRFAPGSYELRLRYRDSPTTPGVPSPVYPGVVARVNFVVGPSPELVTQVPIFSTNAAIGLSLMLLALGVFAVRRQA